MGKWWEKLGKPKEPRLCPLDEGKSPRLGDHGEEEDDPDAEDPEHQGHQSPDTMSVFGSSLGDPEEEAEMVEVTVEVEDDPSLESELAAEEVD